MKKPICVLALSAEEGFYSGLLGLHLVGREDDIESFDYSMLDTASSRVRLRLDATVVDANLDNFDNVDGALRSRVFTTLANLVTINHKWARAAPPASRDGR